MVSLNLIVIKTQNAESTIQWYTKNFALNFSPEKHQAGVLHYSATLENGLIEIYPTKKKPSLITFGFSIDKFAFEKIVKTEKHKFIDDKIILINDDVGNSLILALVE